MRVLFACVAALLLLAAQMEEVQAQDAPTVTEVIVRSNEGGDYFTPWGTMGSNAGVDYYSPVGLAASVVVGVKFSSPVVVTGTPAVENPRIVCVPRSATLPAVSPLQRPDC